MSFLLDTNILSELRKGPRCDDGVRRWALSATRAKQYVSVLSLGEIRKGIELLRRRSPEQCPAFEMWLARLRIECESSILPVTEEIADRWGELMAERTVPVADGLIAATALEHDLTVVTRNVADFRDTGVRLVNPFV